MAEFCPNCGAEVAAERVEVPERARQKPTAAWYLVPFFFGILGGIVGYVAVKDDDKGMANNLLIFGIVWTFLWVILWLIFAAIMVSTMFRPF
jgi:uncharacterized membrane protein